MAIIGRRKFITVLGSATAWPLAARAQQPALPVIGLVSSGSLEPNTRRLDAFRKGLSTTGFIEGKNVAIEYRWAAGSYDRLPTFAAELVQIPVNVLVAFDNTATALAAKAATSTIPIVFSIGTDPVKFGLVSSLNRPGGNVTGVVSLTVGLGVKRLQVLQEMLPNAGTIAMLVNPKNPAAESETAAVLAAAKASGENITILKASTSSEIDAAFATAAEQHAAGLLILSEPFFTESSRADRSSGSKKRAPSHRCLSRVCPCRGADELWSKLDRGNTSGRHLCGPHPQGG